MNVSFWTGHPGLTEEFPPREIVGAVIAMGVGCDG